MMNFSTVVFSQKDTTVTLQQEVPVMYADKNFSSKYKRQLELLIRTYPMALKAKELIDEYESDLSSIEKKRKRKKYGKKAHEELKDEFIYNIRDLYQSEGRLLMKLIHRETDLTVNDIIAKYRGKFQTSMYTGLAKLWGQDLNATFDAEGDDWVTEFVIQDILSGRIEFDLEMRKMNKAEYKESMKQYRIDKKESKKRLKEFRKQQRAEKRKKKKQPSTK